MELGSNQPQEQTYTCLQLRHEKLADPKRLSHAAQLHLQQCLSCQAFASRIDKMENHITDVLNVPVPEGLSERILLRESSRPSAPKFAWRAWALAASVVLTLALSYYEFYAAVMNPNLAHEAIAHVIHEPESFTDHRLADPKNFDTVLASFGGHVAREFATVRFMKLCPVPGGTGWHIVMDTEYGMVTLLLMPGKHNAEEQRVHEGSLTAITKSRGQGYYAVVADNAQALKMITDALEKDVRWVL